MMVSKKLRLLAVTSKLSKSCTTTASSRQRLRAVVRISLRWQQQRKSLLRLPEELRINPTPFCRCQRVRPALSVFIRDLAKHEKSTALAQLASRMTSTIRFSSGSKADIFEKVKGLIRDMVAKLEADAEADATKKAYCDKELAETNQ